MRGWLYVEVEEELVRMRSQFYRIDLVFDFVVDPLVDDIRGKHVSFEQKSMVCLQRIKGFFQRARGRGYLSQLFGRTIQPYVPFSVPMYERVYEEVLAGSDS